MGSAGRAAGQDLLKSAGQGGLRVDNHNRGAGAGAKSQPAQGSSAYTRFAS